MVVLWICKTRCLKTTDLAALTPRATSFFPRSLPSFPLLAVSILQATGSWRVYCKRREAGECTARTGSQAGLGTANALPVFCTQFALPSELAKPPLPRSSVRTSFTSNFTATNQAESHGCQPPFLKIIVILSYCCYTVLSVA